MKFSMLHLVGFLLTLNVTIFAPYKMDKASSSGTEHLYILYKVHVYKTWISICCYGKLLYDVIHFL
jgi:hypothetical protein